MDTAVGTPILGDLAWPIVSRLPLGGDLAVSPHGIMVAVGVLVGAAMMVRRVRRTGLVPAAGGGPAAAGPPIADDDPADAVRTLLGWALLGAMVGARGFFVLTHLDVYAPDPVRVLAVQEGGLTFLGGVSGGVATGWVVARRRGWDALALLDAAAPGLALGLAIGRLGDLAIGANTAPRRRPGGDGAASPTRTRSVGPTRWDGCRPLPTRRWPSTAGRSLHRSSAASTRRLFPPRWWMASPAWSSPWCCWCWNGGDRPVGRSQRPG